MQMRMVAAARAALVVLTGCEGIGSVGSAPDTEVEAEAPPLDPRLTAHLPEGMSISVAERGRELYPTCGVCHGMDGEGTQLGPPLGDGEWIHISGELDEIARVTRSGVASPKEYPIPMPLLGGGDFDETDVRALAAYVFLLSRSGAAPADPDAGGGTGPPTIAPQD